MKNYFYLILASLLLCLFTAYFAFDLDNRIANPTDINKLNIIKREFVHSTPALVEIDFTDLYPGGELYRPNIVNNKTDIASAPCLPGNVQIKMSERSLNKEEIWEEYRCKKRKNLPERFFETPPFMHESGKSYALIAYESGDEAFTNLDWLFAHFNVFHVLELRLVVHLSPKKMAFTYLTGLSSIHLGAVNSGNDDFLATWYFRKVQKGTHIAYKVYDPELFDQYLQKNNFFVTNYSEGENCFYLDEGTCYQKSPGQIIKVIKQYSVLIFVASLIVFFFVAMVLYKRIKQQRFEEESKRHAFRVLTHELRTPIANLLLMVERINKDSSTLPHNIQEDILKMESEIYRLKRLAEKSSSYLTTHDGKSLISFQFNRVESVNELFADMVAPYISNGVKFIPSIKDGSFSLDLYWANLCLKNLIENSITHGKFPFVVEVNLLENELHVCVRDSGSTSAENLEDLISRKWTQYQSGLGLGLSIVSSIMKEMNGKLLFANSPTVFTLIFKDKK